MKRIILTIVMALIVFGGAGYGVGYSMGYTAGNSEGWEKGTIHGNAQGYEKGYTAGFDNGKEYVVTHLDQYVTIPKAVAYEEVLGFLKEDKTDEQEFIDQYFDCISFANDLKERATTHGIKCAVVSMDLTGTKRIGHAINAFETTDRGIVYFDPQTDGQRYGIEVGGYYTLSERYKITKVDIIW
ncbi:MAG: hypothetical protein JW901_03305 [Dehalococcoidia bacterium]|nr:hypothetical protein [Dehalococcoidia bacterium]